MMANSILAEPSVRDAVMASESALRRLANDSLPSEFDRPILELGERDRVFPGAPSRSDESGGKPIRVLSAPYSRASRDLSHRSYHSEIVE